MEKKTQCLRCFGKGTFEGVYGRTVCGTCDGDGKVSVQERKKQLKERRDLLKSLNGFIK